MNRKEAETMTTTFDTSGAVKSPTGVWPPAGPHQSSRTALTWADLSPFAQGYVEAMLAAVMVPSPVTGTPRLAAKPVYTTRAAAFSDLAPETLAQIIADCEARADSLGAPWKTRWLGQQFWEMRQRDEFAGGSYDWPPLTVQLGDDGKVRFA